MGGGGWGGGLFGCRMGQGETRLGPEEPVRMRLKDMKRAREMRLLMTPGRGGRISRLGYLWDTRAISSHSIFLAGRRICCSVEQRTFYNNKHI